MKQKLFKGTMDGWSIVVWFKRLIKASNISRKATKSELTVFLIRCRTIRSKESVDLQRIEHGGQDGGGSGGQGYIVVSVTRRVPSGAGHARSGQIQRSIRLLAVQPVAVEVHIKLSDLGVLKVGEVQEYHKGVCRPAP